jgi:N-acetylmuramoyl-L-alanine amidase
MEKFDVIQMSKIPGLVKEVRRSVHSAFWHCSASDRPEYDDARVMEAWHKERGFKEIGYHAFVCKDGTVQMGRDWNKTPAAQQNHNTGSMAFCLHGLKLEAFTAAQIGTMRDLSRAVDAAFSDKNSKLRWRGHREVAAKLCPVVDYKTILGLDAHGNLGAGTSRYPESTVYIEEALRIFDRGPSVEAVQRKLKERGYNLSVDGVFGRETDKIVRQFQRDHRLKVDGIVGSSTMAALWKVRA